MSCEKGQHPRLRYHPTAPWSCLIQAYLHQVKLGITSILPSPKGRSSLEHPGLLFYPLYLYLLLSL